jgi:transposase
MKTIVKIDPDKEYNLAKQAISSLGQSQGTRLELSYLDSSVDNLKTVINVLLERAAPKKRKRPPKRTKKNKKDQSRLKAEKLPSERFPELQIEENIVNDSSPPTCNCCNKLMSPSGLYKTAEKLEVIPKKYYISRSKRVIYNCSFCHGSMINAKAQPSIIPCSNYGDSVIIDVSLSKYCDLLPIERYSAMAARDGVEGLAPNSLIGLTHSFADFLMPGYLGLKNEVQTSRLVFIDETPHRMLEGDDTSSWYLWGFASKHACIFEAHNTRSGDVPLEFLRECVASCILTDGYGGYGKAIRELGSEGREIQEANCNAHAYRYFEEASVTWEDESQVFLELYGSIYELERSASTVEQKREAREEMRPLFAKLKAESELTLEKVMPHSKLAKAASYLLNRYEKLTKCLQDIEVLLDNNFSERLLRNPVIGRKTWYGTHSKRGARTNAILFSLVESCKINHINPRNYFVWLTEQIHSKKIILTPFQYSKQIDSG